ncbi:hypothetical protein ILYODFUR_025370 [Ilyodon furcidens]|uniref:Uncharacterized protein n=1 Tax=Ilyodon furcidens TaxID=33524 RepID=A0ABV0T3A5_9TELE
MGESHQCIFEQASINAIQSLNWSTVELVTPKKSKPDMLMKVLDVVIQETTHMGAVPRRTALISKRHTSNQYSPIVELLKLVGSVMHGNHSPLSFSCLQYFYCG